MTGIRAAIADYLAVRRALGYKLEDHGWLLAEFATFLEDRDAGTITTELALAWATEPHDALPSWWAARLRVVRGFARHVKAFDPATEIPPIGLLACSNRRAMPYVYADAEVCALMSATTSLRPALHAATYRTLLGLLAVSGMRLGEVIRLDRPDLDTAEAIVTIRDSKFGKSRQVPLHPSTLDALAEYARVRDRCCPEPSAPSLLISTAGTRLIRQNVEYVFARLVRSAGLGPARMRAVRGCTTSATPWPCTPCSAGIATASTCKHGCRCCPPCSGTPSQPTPTGTSPPSRNCSPWPPSGETAASEPADEPPRPDPGRVLHRAAGQPTPCQRQYRRRLP